MVTSVPDELGTDWAGWEQSDAHETALGEAEGRPRKKVVPREDLVRISRG